MDADDLKDRIDIYLPRDIENDMGESVREYSLIRSIWASIRTVSGVRRTDNGTEFFDVVHKVTVRKASLPDICTEMYFENCGLKLYVESWEPTYKRKGFLTVACKGVIE